MKHGSRRSSGSSAAYRSRTSRKRISVMKRFDATVTWRELNAREAVVSVTGRGGNRRSSTSSSASSCALDPPLSSLTSFPSRRCCHLGSTPPKTPPLIKKGCRLTDGVAQPSRFTASSRSPRHAVRPGCKQVRLSGARSQKICLKTLVAQIARVCFYTSKEEAFFSDALWIKDFLRV